jgi:hypothetical protein
VERGTAFCQPWQIDPEAGFIATSRPRGQRAMREEITFEVRGEAVYFRSYFRDYQHKELGVENVNCSDRVEVGPDREGATVARGVWFRDQSACKAAISERRGVATELPCIRPARVEPEVSTAMRTKLETLLDKGGMLYTTKGKLCGGLKVVPLPKKKRDDDLEGGLSTPIVMNGVKGTWTQSYKMDRGEEKVFIMAGGYTLVNGEGAGVGCVGNWSLEMREGFVLIGNAPTFFTEVDCQTFVRDERARRDLLPAREAPRDPDDESDVLAADGAVGTRPRVGC